MALAMDGKFCLNSPSISHFPNIVESRQRFHRNGGGFYSARKVYNSVPYTEIWINFSIRMLMKTSITFSLPDEEGYLNIRYHAGP